MRSRFDAFRGGDAQWLLASWHPTTRPSEIDLTENPQWRGLQIVDVVDGLPGDEMGVVEFRATYVTASGSVAVHHERSRFVRDDARWYYLEAIDPLRSSDASPG